MRSEESAGALAATVPPRPNLTLWRVTDTLN